MNHAYGRETRRYMLFALVAGLALLGVESWLFGARLWALGAVGAAASLAVEWLFAKVRRKPATGGAAVHGLMLALLVPSDLPFWMMALAAVVGTLFAQEAFGGLETCVFHPVLIAKTFLLVSYPSHNAACTLTTPEMQEALGLKVSQFQLLMGDRPQGEKESAAGANYARQHVESLVKRLLM